MRTPFMNNTVSIPIPLTPEAHQYARKFAAQQLSPEKARRVYLRTLAVYAVNAYLRCIQVETALENSDSWNPLNNILIDGADLDLPGIGKLECCPVLPGAEYFTPPQIVLSDRIVYVAVQFKEVLDEVELIGYRPILDPEHPPQEIYIDDIQTEVDSDDGYNLFPIQNLSDYLSYVKVIRDGLEEMENPLIEGVRQMLEQQMRSPAQLAVQAIYEAIAFPETIWGIRGEQLLTGASSTRENSSEQSSTLSMNLDDENSEQASVTNEPLRTMGSQFLQWVKSKLDAVTD